MFDLGQWNNSGEVALQKEANDYYFNVGATPLGIGETFWGQVGILAGRKSSNEGEIVDLC